MSDTPFLFYLVLWFAASNATSYVLMFLDKRAAKRGTWRTSEATLQAWFLCGGSFGGKVAQRVFRHKTRKQPFARMLNFHLVLNVICYATLCIPESQEVILTAVAQVAAMDG